MQKYIKLDWYDLGKLSSYNRNHVVGGSLSENSKTLSGFVIQYFLVQSFGEPSKVCATNDTRQNTNDSNLKKEKKTVCNLCPVPYT